MKLKVVGTLEKRIAGGTARENVAKSLAVIKLQIGPAQTRLKFGDYTSCRYRQRMPDGIKIIKTWPVIQAGVRALSNAPGIFPAEPEVLFQHEIGPESSKQTRQSRRHEKLIAKGVDYRIAAACGSSTSANI